MSLVVKRSPAHPGMNLEEAIKRTKMFHDASKRYAVSRSDSDPVAYKNLGYKTPNGAAKRALGTVLSYGLLEKLPGGDDSKVRVSSLGFDIVALREDDPTKTIRIREAARNPKIFAELLKEFHDGLPSSDTPIHSFLVKRGFNLESIDPLIRDFRSTVTFARLFDEDRIADYDTDLDEPNPDQEDETDQSNWAVEKSQLEAEIKTLKDQVQRKQDLSSTIHAASTSSEIKTHSIPILGGRQAFLQVPVGLTAKDFLFLQGYLTLMKDAIIGDSPTSEGDGSTA